MPSKIKLLTCFARFVTPAVLVMMQMGLLLTSPAGAGDGGPISAELTMRHGIGKRPGVVHGTLHNRSSEMLNLVAVNSDMFDRIEIHTMTSTDGIMRMRRLADLPLPAGETVTLKPGGLHLMLFGFRGTARDKPVTMRLTAQQASGKSHRLDVMVMPGDEMKSHGGGKHHKMGH